MSRVPSASRTTHHHIWPTAGSSGGLETNRVKVLQVSYDRKLTSCVFKIKP